MSLPGILHEFGTPLDSPLVSTDGVFASPGPAAKHVYDLAKGRVS